MQSNVSNNIRASMEERSRDEEIKSQGNGKEMAMQLVQRL
jgi:hypothetical protein